MILKIIGTVLLVVAAYLLGSIPSAVWIGKRFYGVDVRQHGSHNAGTTNVLRVLGRRAALPVFIIDFFKGYAAVSLAWLSPFRWRSLDNDYFFYFEIVLAVAAVLGHMFPVFVGFKGGKGVATIGGALLALMPQSMLVALVIFSGVFLASGYVSLGSIIAAITFPFVVAYITHRNGGYDVKSIIFGVLIAIALLITHRNNIKRLLNGEENKIRIFFRKSNKDNGKSEEGESHDGKTDCD